MPYPQPIMKLPLKGKTAEKASSSTYSEVDVTMPQMEGNNIPCLVAWQVELPAGLLNADADTVECLLRTTPVEVIQDIEDPNVIDKIALEANLAGAAFHVVHENVITKILPGPVPVTSQVIKFGVKSTQSGTIKLKLWYEIQYIAGVRQQNNIAQQVQY